MRTWWIWPVLLMIFAAAGCASTSSAPAATHRTVHVGFGDSGHTVRVQPGDVIEVRLHSTYWSFAHLPDGPLREGKAIVRAVPISKTVPGSGAGTVTVTFAARHRGTVTISAGRRVCGEAMRCVGSQGSFRMQVVVG